jgi:hypothetical protein
MPQFEDYPHEKSQDLMEVHFTRSDFDKWISRLTATKFNNYLAWFNINIKQVNQDADMLLEEQEPSQGKKHKKQGS